MSDNRSWDGLQLSTLDLPYNTILREIDDTPRLIGGTNSYVTYGGKLIKRFGTIQVDSTLNTTLTKRVDRLWIYETLDSPPKVYLVASAFDSTTSTWGLYYIRLDSTTTPAWTTAGTLRGIDKSQRPHEAVISRGLLYVKGYPNPNLLQYSQDFTNAAWTKTSTTVTAAATTAPDGTNTGTRVTGTTADSYLFQEFTVVPNIPYTASFYAKGTGSVSSLGYILENSNGAGSFTGALTSAVSTVINGSWTRYTISFVPTGTHVSLLLGGGGTVTAGQTVYIWGAQVEAGGAATAYRVTTNATPETLGTVIFDGTAGVPTTTFWGLLGPTTPARMSGTLHHLNADITAAATSFVFDSVASLPATPFNVQIDYEVITVVTLVGTTATVVLRGAQGTVAAAHTAQAPVIYRNWTASAHPVAVNMFWAYSYAYKTKTGHISNRAALETNPDNLPSLTGPFTNLIPKITVQGHADTTNVPTIVIYRSTDGGGSSMKLEEITNTGAGSITYEDKSRASSSGNADPVLDSSLNPQSLAPTLTSNSPPPTVLAPAVVGTDLPIASTPMASYQGRLWFAIGNVLFYSANEELNTGIPEEAWPSGLYGNFFRFQYPIVNVEGTSDALYVLTTQAVYEISGSTLETFNVRPILNNIGAATGHPRAITRFGDAVIWLTNDLRIAILQGTNFRTISEPLGLDYINLINTKSAEIDIKYWAETDKEWIVVTAICPTSTDTRTWVYDVKKSAENKVDFWNTPWTIRTTALASGRARETAQQRRLMFFTWTGSTGFLTRITTNSTEITGTDDIPSALSSAFDFQIKTNLFMTVTGDHVNVFRRPGLIPIIYNFLFERTAFAGDTDPTVYYYLNDFWTTPVPTTPSNVPARDDEPMGYKTMIYGIQKKGKRIALRIDKLASTELFELQDFTILWNADAGAGV